MFIKKLLILALVSFVFLFVSWERVEAQSSITYGSAFRFDAAGSTLDHDVISLDANTFVEVYSDCSGVIPSLAKVGTVSGSTISYGLPYQFDPVRSCNVSAAALDSTHFVVVYDDTGYLNAGTAVVGTVNGSTITFGPEARFNGWLAGVTSVARLDAGKFVVAYQDLSVSSFGYLRIGTVSGSTISFGSTYLFNNSNTGALAVSSFDSSSFVVAYKDGTIAGSARVGTVSGASIAFGPEYTIVSSEVTIPHGSLTTLDSSTFVVGYVYGNCLNFGCGQGRVRVGSRSGTALSFGGEYTLSGVTGQGPPYLVSLDTTSFVASFAYDSGALSRVGEVLGSSITFGSESSFRSGATGMVKGSALSTTKIVNTYAIWNQLYGEAVIGAIGPSNNPPNIPALDAPPTGWINYNPTYQATITDPDSGDIVHAYFDFASGPADGAGSSGTTPYQSTYTPTTPDGQYQWRAKGVDAGAAESAYTGYRTVKKDTVGPVVSLTGSSAVDIASWDWSGTTDATSGLRSSNTFYRNVDSNLEGQGYSDGWTTATSFSAGPLPDGTYSLMITAYDQANNSTSSSWVSVTIDTTATIQGFVWDDTANRNCVFDAGETKLSGRTIVATGPSSGSDVTNGSGDYAISGLLPSVNPNDYSVSVDLPGAEWNKVCPTNDGTLYESVTLAPGETRVLNFGLEFAPSAWYQATWSVNGINGDIHSNGNISIPVPSGQFLVSGSGGGLVSATGTIDTFSGGASEVGWDIGSYSEIPWPTALINGVTGDNLSGMIKVKYYPTDLTIDLSTLSYLNSLSPVIVVATNITVAADVGDNPGSTTNRINAILIAKNNFTVDDSTGNKMLNIKGSVIAQTIIINRELDDNSYPAMKTEFDPQYFVHNVPYFTQATFFWEEVE